MHRTTVKVSAPNIDDLKLIPSLAHNPSHVYLDEVDLMAHISFEFDPGVVNADDLLEMTMERIDIISLEEDPRFEHCNIESVNEYPCEVA